MDANTARQRSRTYAELARAFSEAKPGLQREFTRLFLGPGRPVAHPYESVYREGRMVGDTTLDVRRRLIEEGLVPRHQIQPDHVGIELAFMAHLASREALAWEIGDTDGARNCLSRQASFLQDHLATWLPQFCHRILVGRPHTHYADLAHRTEAFVTGDAAGVLPCLEDVSPALSEAEATGSGEGVAATAGRELWTVTVSRGCTLCDICVQVCRPAALQLTRQAEPGVVTLRFDATLCDGCAACQRWCPESAISVSTAAGSDRYETKPANCQLQLASSAMLACPRCGRLHAPEAMLAKVQARIGTTDEAFLQRMALCHDCKAGGNPLQQAFN